jgi:hypothetical protein
MASRIKIAVLGVVVVATGLSLSTPASAGFLDRIFGGIRDAISGPPRQPSNMSSLVDPSHERRAEVSPSKGFCVRTCDGKFFPVQTRAGMSAAESCNSFCPATPTKIFSGNNIDTAVASDGTRYDDLDTAFSFREKLVAGCTCNGKTPGGLASMDVNKDPTLRSGDIVATKTGLVAFTGANNSVANFTPIDSYRGLPQSARDKLSDVKIMPPTPGNDELTTATVTPATDRPRTTGRNTQAWR